MTFSIISKQEVQMYGELLLLILRFIGISAGYYTWIIFTIHLFLHYTKYTY